MSKKGSLVITTRCYYKDQTCPPLRTLIPTSIPRTMRYATCGEIAERKKCPQKNAMYLLSVRCMLYALELLRSRLRGIAFIFLVEVHFFSTDT